MCRILQVPARHPVFAFFPAPAVGGAQGDGMAGEDMLDLGEWAEVRDKLHRFHTDITDRVKAIVMEMMTAFKPELMVTAEQESKRGQEVEAVIETMWVLEDECAVMEDKFQGFVGCSWDELDIENVDVDFIEDLMLRAKPMNEGLADVRARQVARLAEVRATYWDAIKGLEGMVVKRPPPSNPVAA